MNDSTRAGAAGPPEAEVAQHLPRARGVSEARLGVFVIAGLLSFITVLFLLTDPATLRGRYMVHTVVDDAGGVRRGDPIQMRGVNIGRIHSFEMRPDGEVTITLEVEGEWKIPEGSRTRLGAAGIFGGRTVEILPGPGPGFVEEGDTLPGEGGRAGGILGSVDDLSTHANRVLRQVEAFLDDSTVAAMQGGARELEGLLSQMSEVIREQRGEIRALTVSLREAAEGVQRTTEEVGPDLTRAIARADSMMASLNETGREVDATLSSLRAILARVESGEGTLGRLVRDSTLYVNVNAAAAELATLLAEFRENPKRFVNISIF